jgi:hypothetical protein
MPPDVPPHHRPVPPMMPGPAPTPVASPEGPRPVHVTKILKEIMALTTEEQTEVSAVA